MKIKLALLDSNKEYLDRLSSGFAKKYEDKLEVHCFSDQSVAMSELKELRINVFVANEVFDVDLNDLPKQCGFAYFVDSSIVEMFKDQKAICRFQKIENIYKEVLAIYSENLADLVSIRFDNDSSTKIFTFVSASGGVGSSTVAVACAKYFTQKGSKVLYLNLEQFGNTGIFFRGDGKSNFSDVIYALKSSKVNLPLKLKSIIKRDTSGVSFYESAKTVFDLQELKSVDISKLISTLKQTGEYDFIISDIDFNFSEVSIEIYKSSSAIIFVSDGSEISNGKFVKAYAGFEILEQQLQTPLCPYISLFYNKFSNKTSASIDGEVRSIGGAPRYEYASSEHVISQLMTLKVFDNIDKH
jgi:MinD-like ATPase involved in chromosome partitioning or flagellar assembly